MGREPFTRSEWNAIRKQAREMTAKTEGLPSLTSKTTQADILKGPVVDTGSKGPRTWDLSKKQKEAKVVDLFASEKEFTDDLYSMGQNFIKNDPLFNLELATKLRNPGVKTYGWTPSGDKSKLLSPKQRQTALDKLKEVMKHEEYANTHAEELGYVDLTDDIFTIEKAEGGRIGMAGGGALFKFIERLFIKASNDIRLGKGKWKGLDQRQIVVQHDNLTKKMVEFQKSGKTVGLEEYFGVDPHTAFIAARDKAKRLGIKKDFKKQEIKAQQDEFFSDKDAAKEWDYEAGVTSEGVSKIRTMDERQLLKTKYPGISDDLLNKILIDDNPQRMGIKAIKSINALITCNPMLSTILAKFIQSS